MENSVAVAKKWICVDLRTADVFRAGAARERQMKNERAAEKQEALARECVQRAMERAARLTWKEILYN